MSIVFKKATRENVPLLMGFVGGTGSGKTYTALRIAKGIANVNRFAVIDTENGRALHYADKFDFDHANLHAPFRPDSYVDAIKAADAAGYPVIVVDSMSHVWAGDGGVLDWQEEELERMAGDNWSKRESCKMAAWIKPKMSHKQMVQQLLQVKAHVILCFRAEAKVEMTKDPETKKMVIHAKQSLTGLDGWIPVCEKTLPFELTTSILFTADKPGIPQPIKLQEQHKAFFPLNKVVDEESGRMMAEWAAGGVPAASPSAPAEQASDGSEYITVDQQIELDDALHAAKLRAGNPHIKEEFLSKAKIQSLSKLPSEKYQKAVDMINAIGKGE